MFTDLERLISLQKLNTEISEGKDRIAAHPGYLEAANLGVNNAQKARGMVEQQGEKNQELRRSIEKDAAIYQSRVSKFKDQLNAVKTNREYQAMQKELELAIKELRETEDKLLENMLQADTLATEIDEASTKLASEKKSADTKHSSLETELQAVEKSLNEATVARSELENKLDKELLNLFEQVAQARKGIGVCAAQDGLCCLCHVRLRLPVYQQLQHNNSIIQCESCNRILYYAPPNVNTAPSKTQTVL